MVFFSLFLVKRKASPTILVQLTNAQRGLVQQAVQEMMLQWQNINESHYQKRSLLPITRKDRQGISL